jgi:RNA polymerase sigma factor (sigma-70 family)
MFVFPKGKLDNLRRNHVRKMETQSDTFTCVTLLGRLASGVIDDAAWQEFVDRYGPHVILWCKDRGCPQSEVEDILQEVLIKLMQAFRSFRYDPKQRFRSWLATVTQNTVIDLFRSRQLRVRGTGDTDVWVQLQSVSARNDLYERLNAAFDLELFEQACASVRAKVQPHLWQTFELTNLQQLSPDEAARQLRIPTATLYVTRSRVVAQVKAEVERLQREVDGDGQ